MTESTEKVQKAEKTGIVLGGGGSRGSYEIGVLQTLTDQGRTFDVVTGTSIGAICGALYTQGSVDHLTDWIGSFTQDSVARNLFVFPAQYTSAQGPFQDAGSFFAAFSKNGPQVEPLRQKLESLFDYKTFASSSKDFACMTYNVTKQKPQMFTKLDMTADNAIDVLLASAAYFPAFNFVTLNGDYYIDGGFAETNPVQAAQKLGADSLVVVDVQDMDVPDPVLNPGDLLIRPIWKLAYYLDFDGVTLRNQVALGRLDALKYLNLAPGYLYTFYPGDWNHMQRLETSAMELVAAEGESWMLEKMDPVMEEIYQFILGYVPRKLENKYSHEFIFGRILECMGLVAGISPYRQMHFNDFIRELLEKFSAFDSDPNKTRTPMLYHAMEMKGLQDMLVFFHSAIQGFNGHLPKEFGILREKYLLPYYLAWGWHLMEKFRLFLLI
ncbi:patatin-like phospholipase family protein [Faecalibaculum rodentium]|uniref:patatin-like phospholipase family protein n=1 Tax=Faecalibaculum rodentium TaxID=1702221 RepID=UPI0026F3972C|nr:patatin-like phospholipase family protein [Faecalibaculum rodentium]